MFRTFAKLLGAAAGLAPTIASGLGLGPAEVESYLNELLLARVPLASCDPKGRAGSASA